MVLEKNAPRSMCCQKNECVDSAVSSAIQIVASDNSRYSYTSVPYFDHVVRRHCTLERDIKLGNTRAERGEVTGRSGVQMMRMTEDREKCSMDAKDITRSRNRLDATR